MGSPKVMNSLTIDSRICEVRSFTLYSLQKSALAGQECQRRMIMDIVLKLRELRRLKGLSQKKVEKLSGVSEKTLSSFESGARIHTLKLVQLQKLLRVYGITEEEFFSKTFEKSLEEPPVSHSVSHDSSRESTKLSEADREKARRRYDLDIAISEI